MKIKILVEYFKRIILKLFELNLEIMINNKEKYYMRRNEYDKY